MPAVMPIARLSAAPVAPSAPPSPYQSALPKCDDADIIMKVVKLSVGFAGGITDYLIVGDTHALSINNIDGSKVCVTNFRADLEKARAAEAWITSGSYPLTQMAANINYQYDMARPMHVTFSNSAQWRGWIHFQPAKPVKKPLRPPGPPMTLGNMRKIDFQRPRLEEFRRWLVEQFPAGRPMCAPIWRRCCCPTFSSST